MNIVDDKTSLQIGRYYLVRCAKVKVEHSKTVYVPIIGEQHTDVKFGVYFFHYHIDGRFIDRIHQHYKVDEQGRTNTLISVMGDTFHEFQGIEIKRKKCVRLTTGVKPPPRGTLNHKGESRTEKYYKWYDSMIGEPCKGKICPHRGITMQEIEGVLVCPLHNLRGSIEDEVIKEI